MIEVVVRMFGMEAAATVWPVCHPVGRGHAGRIAEGMTICRKLVTLSRVCRAIIRMILLARVGRRAGGGERPGRSVVVWCRRSTVGSRRRRIFRDIRTDPTGIVLRALLVLRGDRPFGGHERLVLHGVCAMQACLDRSQLLQLLDFGELGLLFVRMPVFDPHEETLLVLVHHSVDFPVEVCEPLQFHRVEFMDGNAAHFGPRAILEGVVIEEFATEEKAGSEHAVHGTRRRRRLATLLYMLHPTGQVEQAEHDCGARQASRRQNLGDVFAKLRSRGRFWCYTDRNVRVGRENSRRGYLQFLGHLSDEAGHQIHVIIEMLCDTSRRLVFLGL